MCRLAFHHADGFYAYAAAADYFDCFEFFLHQFDNGVVFGCGLNELYEDAVSAVVDYLCLKSLCDLEDFYLVLPGCI